VVQSYTTGHETDPAIVDLVWNPGEDNFIVLFSDSRL